MAKSLGSKGKSNWRNSIKGKRDKRAIFFGAIFLFFAFAGRSYPFSEEDFVLPFLKETGEHFRLFASPKFLASFDLSEFGRNEPRDRFSAWLESRFLKVLSFGNFFFLEFLDAPIIGDFPTFKFAKSCKLLLSLCYFPPPLALRTASLEEVDQWRLNTIKQAMILIDQAIRGNPRNAHFYFFKGLIILYKYFLSGLSLLQEKTGNGATWEEIGNGALKQFSISISLNSSFFLPRLFRATFLFDTQKPAKAMPDILYLLKFGPKEWQKTLFLPLKERMEASLQRK